MVAGLACGSQWAVSGEGHVPPENDPRDAVESPYLNVAAIGGTTTIDMSVDVRAEQKSGDMLDELGLAGNGVFPSRGGPIDE